MQLTFLGHSSPKHVAHFPNTFTELKNNFRSLFKSKTSTYIKQDSKNFFDQLDQEESKSIVEDVSNLCFFYIDSEDDSIQISTDADMQDCLIYRDIKGWKTIPVIAQARQKESQPKVKKPKKVKGLKKQKKVG